jgi:hypothetical protein
MTKNTRDKQRIPSDDDISESSIPLDNSSKRITKNEKR